MLLGPLATASTMVSVRSMEFRSLQRGKSDALNQFRERHSNNCSEQMIGKPMKRFAMEWLFHCLKIKTSSRHTHIASKYNSEFQLPELAEHLFPDSQTHKETFHLTRTGRT